MICEWGLAESPASLTVHHGDRSKCRYGLIDYVNFKGDSTSPTEKYTSQGWGLLQMLGGMNSVLAGSAVASDFTASAKRALSRRIENSPPERGEARWREG